MQKKYAMSNMGYAIVLIIILGVFMIISAPMIVDNYKNDNKNNQNTENSYERNRNNDYDARVERRARERRRENYNNEAQMVNLMDEIRGIERRFDSRLNELEARQREIQENPRESSENETVSDKFVCSIEGYLESDGHFVSAKETASTPDLKTTKLMFVCEYKE